MASSRPCSVMSGSCQPVKTFSRFHSLCPCRISTNLPMAQQGSAPYHRPRHMWRLGPYRVEDRPFASGATAEVFIARRGRTGQRVAIKLLPLQDLSRTCRGRGRRGRDRPPTAAAACIERVVDERRGVVGLVMDLVDGGGPARRAARRQRAEPRRDAADRRRRARRPRGAARRRAGPSRHQARERDARTSRRAVAGATRRSRHRATRRPHAEHRLGARHRLLHRA